MMRIVKSLLLLVFGLVLLVALLFGAVQTQPGKAMLARTLSSLASSPDLQVEISGLTGLVPFDMRVGSVRVADREGEVARVDDLTLAWRPLALLNRTVDITRLKATRVELLRRPLPPNEPPPPGEPPSLAVPIRIGELSFPDIVIAEPVLDHAARLSLTGSADIASLARGLSLDFALQRLDAEGSLTGRASYAPESDTLDLDIAAREPAGGLMARAAGLEGLPEITATLKGAGPLDAWDGQLGVTVGTLAQATGAAGIRAVPDGHRLTFAIDADMARLLPPDLAPLAEGRTELAGAALIDAERRITLEPTTLRAAGLGALVHGTIAPDRTADLTFDATAGAASRFSALAPGIGWTGLTLAGTAKGNLARPSLDARLSATGLTGVGYGASEVDATLRTVPNGGGAMAIIIEGDAQGLSASDPEVAGALGTAGTFSASGTLPADGPATLTELTARLTALTAHFAGTATSQSIDGDLDVQRLDLTAFGPLAGRPLGGQAQFKARVAGSADLARLSLDLNGAATGLVTGIAQIDRLLGQQTRFTGAVARDGANALAVRELKLTSDGLAVTVDGRIATDLANLTAKVALDDLARLDPRVSGAAQADAVFSGTLDKLGITATLRIPQGTAMDRPLRDIAVDVTASDITSAPSGSFTLAGEVAGKPARGAGALASGPNGSHRLTGLDLSIGSVTARGDLAISAHAKATGRLAIAAGNLADASVLALTEITGRLDADVTLDVVDGQQRIAATGDAANITLAGRSLTSARIDATVTDPLGVPLVNGDADLRGLDLGGTTVESANVRAIGNAAGTDMTIDAVAQGFTIRTAARLTPQAGGAQIRLDRLAATRGSLTLTTAAPATFVIENGTVRTERVVLNASGGSLTIAGTVGDTLNLTVDARALPLALAELAAPGLNLSGTLAGNARVTGTPAAPTGTYELRIARMSTPDIARSGAGPFDIAASGTLADRRASLRATVNGANLQGLTVTGSVPVGDGQLDLAVRGVVNLAIVNPVLATTGARILGTANVDVTIRGTAAAPSAGGTVRISGGRFDDNVNGIALAEIQAVLTGTDRSVTLTSLTARTTNGGSVTGRGTIALDPAAGFPGRIDLDLVNAALVNSDLMRLVAEGRLGVEGAFLNGPRLTGRITLRALDISIPDRFGGGVRAINVRHVNASKAFTAKRAQMQARPTAASRNDGVGLDLVLAAPNNTVFVRGLGMDAQLGGELRLTGTTRAPIALGGFDLRRGTFDFAGRRLTFTRGRITFTGTTDPELDFVAETTGNDVTARITISGPASRPEVSFSSTPTLPQDEIVARLMFGRSAGNLNAGQAVQVAQAIAQLSGGSGALENLRRSLGVDSLDIGTNEAGTGGQIGIGRRLNDNIYLGVRQGTTSGSSKVTVDIDVTRNIRLQGATGADGSAEVGIGAQWDY